MCLKAVFFTHRKLHKNARVGKTSTFCELQRRCRRAYPAFLSEGGHLVNASPLFKGCATALVTPFLPDGMLDEAALRRLIAMQLDSQIDALVLLGTTGEPCT